MEYKNVDLRIEEDKNVLQTELKYPYNKEIDTIQIGISDIRAADDVRVRYDFERDGWVMEQPRQYYIPEEGFYELGVEWIESAFCPSWQYELNDEQKETYVPAPKNEKTE
jgi:hypothetical protein